MNCIYCGKEITTQAGTGRKRKYCSDNCCRSADRDNKRIHYIGKRQKYCIGCGIELPKYKTKYCSRRCRLIHLGLIENRKEAEKTKQCIVCGKEFITTRMRTLTCSAECSKERALQRDRVSYRERYQRKNPNAKSREQIKAESLERKERLAKEREARAVEREVIEAAKKVERQKILAERQKIKQANIAYWQEYIALHVCVVCGEVYTATYPLSKYCSNKCKHKAYRKKDRYKGITVDNNITLKALARRDNNTCQICGGTVDWDDKKTINGTVICGNNYPSIDHIVPISKGGLHKWDNVQLAHRICNTKKRDIV